MALDGAFLWTIKNEINNKCLGARVEKIYQPTKEQIVILLRWRGGNGKLLIDVGASNPRIHFSNMNFENPQSPPMFCMLLRKHLNSSKLIKVRQAGLDRILFLDFETVNELGDLVQITLAVEIMARHSNLIIINQSGKIIDSIKRVGLENENIRGVLSGMEYQLPTNINKTNILTDSLENIEKTVKLIDVNNLEKGLVTFFEGISPLLSREIIFKANILDGDDLNLIYQKITDALLVLKDVLLNNKISPTILIDENKKPKDFSFIDIKQYGDLFEKLTFEFSNDLLDDFYVKRDRVDKVKQKTSDLIKLLNNKYNRTLRKINIQREELKQSIDRENLKIYGDLINSNIYNLKKGQSEALLQNYYDENFSEIKINLDVRLSPSQNAQKYYNDYKKAVNAEKMLKKLIEKGQQELIYIESVLDSILRIENDNDLMEIKSELSENGYIKYYKLKNKKIKSLPPIEYMSTDGFVIYCGRNNKQNDLLTTKIARSNDMWLHTKDIAGSHVIIISDGREIPNQTIEQAAIIAAFNSKARESTKVPVDYTLIKNVKKPNGAKTGMVIFETNQTAIVTPDEVLVENLKVK